MCFVGRLHSVLSFLYARWAFLMPERRRRLDWLRRDPRVQYETTPANITMSVELWIIKYSKCEWNNKNSQLRLWIKPGKEGKEWERNNEKISKKILIISQSPPLQFFSFTLRSVARCLFQSTSTSTQTINYEFNWQWVGRMAHGWGEKDDDDVVEVGPGGNWKLPLEFAINEELTTI